ncbi:MAG: DUF5996 family protein [Gemmatimonadota bacterium]
MSSRTTGIDVWPALALEDWQDTYTTLHRWLQMVGKTRLALAPMQNHWWQVTLYLSARGLTTSAVPFGHRTFEVEFDFLSHQLVVRTSDGEVASLPLEPRPVAEFYDAYERLLHSLGIHAPIWPVPAELADTLPFTEDQMHASYDGDAAQRCWRALAQADRVLKEFRSRFIGKCSPSHFWWGAFDLACTRFSGRRAPQHPGGVPNISDAVVREAYSHECISAGWWPGTVGGPVAEPAFYAYAYPEPPGCPDARIEPAAAMYHMALREWILPYEAVRSAPHPDAVLLTFLQSTYETAADLGAWDRAALEAGPAFRLRGRPD